MYIKYEIRNFQFKFLHRRIATNSFLFKIKFSGSNLCCFCQTTQETLLHLFWECPITEAFWNSVQNFFVSVDLIPASQVLTLCQCLGLNGEKSALLFNHCLQLGRFYVYFCKYKNVRPSSKEYINQVRCNLKIDDGSTKRIPTEVAQNTPVIVTHCSLLWTFV